jgi:hypothetical protein
MRSKSGITAKRALLAAVLLAIGTAPAWGELMYYDGFAYEPPSEGGTAPDGAFALWKYNANAYQLGDPNLPWTPTDHPTDYSPSPWVAANNLTANGYWPFVIPYDLRIPGMPAGTGHSVAMRGGASNSGKCARVPVGGASGVSSGTVYYSVMVWVIECVSLPEGTQPGNGGFYVGYNDAAADPASANVQRAAARLRMRRAVYNGFHQKMNVGIQADEGQATTLVWDPTIYEAGVPSAPLFVVGSYEFLNNEGETPNLTDDVCSLWVNPDRGTFGQATPPPATVTTSGADIQNLYIRSLFIRAGASSGGAPYPIQHAAFDELRIGTTWADVVPCQPAAVTSMTPSRGRPGTTITGVAITGSSFSAGATDVKLTIAGEPDIVAYNVNVIDSHHFTCDFDLPAGLPQVRTLAVTTCGGTAATLSDVFVLSCSPGDFDCDEDVDVDDLGTFLSCGSGPAIPYQAGCQYEDFDGDGDVDAQDFGVFQRCNGNTPPDPNCAD